MARHPLPRALLAMIAVLLAADLLLPDLGPSLGWSVVQSVLVFFLAAAAGGWLAGRRFLLPAFAVWAAVWLGTGYVLHRISEPVAQASWSGLLASNWLALLLSGVAVALGATAGHRAHQAAPRSGATPA